MEQKTFLAIALSLLVLFAYSSLVSKSAPTPKAINIAELYEDKEVTSYKMQKESTFSPPPISNLKEETNVLSSSDLELELSNLGAKINTVRIVKYNFFLPLSNMFNIKGFENFIFFLNDKEKDKIIYLYEDSNIKIEKSFRIGDQKDLLLVNIKITNKSRMSKEQNFILSNYTLENFKLDKIYLPNEKALLEYSVATTNASATSGALINKVFRKENAVKFFEKERIHKSSQVNWIGFRDRYFCAIFKPNVDFVTESYQINPINENSIELSTKSKKVKLSSEESFTFNWIAYFGPQDINLLKSFKSGFEEVVSFSAVGLFDVVAKGIYTLLGGLHKIIPSWGICIILISFGIYLALYPLTMRGMLSMKKMQSLQPKITKLREQYANNPQRLNREMMELYRENKVNPFGGCLPFLLQMPVFIGLYQVLWRSIYLKGSGFLWVKDLSGPDRLFILPFNLPFLGNELNILPILMAIVMFFQQKITSKNMVYSDANIETQQKLMARIFPVFLGFIFYKFSSGLLLYFITFYLLSTLAQLKMSRILKTSNG